LGLKRGRFSFFIIEDQLKKDINYSIGNYIGSEGFEKRIKDEYRIEKISCRRRRPRKS
jgi:hypothetical protein